MFCNTAMVGNDHDKENSRVWVSKMITSFEETVSRILVFKFILMLGSLSFSQLSVKNGIMSLSLLLKLNVPTLSDLGHLVLATD
jgi:hypothetical protein